MQKIFNGEMVLDIFYLFPASWTDARLQVDSRVTFSAVRESTLWKKLCRVVKI